MRSVTGKRSCAPALWMCVLLALVGVLGLALPLDAFAEESPAKKVRVGYYENEVFEEGAHEGAVKTGYAYEYYRKISEYTGWEYEYVYGDFSDLYQMLLDGEIDLLAGLAWREDRAGLIGYPVEPMGAESYTLVKHADDEDVTAEPATLSGKTIGVLESAMVDVLHEYLDAHDVEAQVVTFSDYDALFAAFDAGDVDVLAAEGDGAYGRDDAEVSASFGTSDYYLCVNVQRPDLLGELDAAQAQLLANEPNYLYSLREKYYPISISSRAFSAAEKNWLDEHDELKIGYLNHYLPYSDTDVQGNPSGMVCDIVPKMLERLGVTGIDVSYQGFDSYDDMIAAVDAGGVDAAFPVGGGLYYSEENGIYQSAPVASSLTDLIYKGEFNDDTMAHFAVNENNRMQYYYVKTNYPDAQVTLYPSIEDCLDAVASGQVSCTTLNGMRASDMLKNRRYSSLSLRQLNQADDRCFGVRIGNEGLLKLINRGISVVGSDYVAKSASSYGEQLYSYTLLDAVLDNLVAFVIALMAVAALIIAVLMRDGRRTKAQKEELADALAAAERANRAKTTFLGNMSHDIRTPMNAIIGFTELARDSLDDEEVARDYLDKISTSSQHLLSLINDVLEMSHIESGKVQLEKSALHLLDLIDGLNTIVGPNTQQKRQQLRMDMSEVSHPDIVADKLRLTRVLLNVLSNAVKYTPEEGSIELRVVEAASGERGSARYDFIVTDNGIGMSEEFQATVFDAFTREQTSTISGIQGTGLGMAITKNLVELMGGTISMQSAEGEGTQVTISLPCEFAPESGTVREMKDAHVGECAEGAHAAVRDAQFEGKRVLLVEDNAMNQQIAQAILRQVGLDVEIANDGLEAVQMMKDAPAEHYGMILMDVQMPRMDGYEATRRIRALDDADKASIPIVAVTANAFAEDKQSAIDAGMDGHLAKPYDIEKMIEVVSEVIR